MKINSQKNWQQILQKAPNHCSFFQKNRMEKSQNKIPFGLFEAKIREKIPRCWFHQFRFWSQEPFHSLYLGSLATLHHGNVAIALPLTGCWWMRQICWKKWAMSICEIWEFLECQTSFSTKPTAKPRLISMGWNSRNPEAGEAMKKKSEKQTTTK